MAAPAYVASSPSDNNSEETSHSVTIPAHSSGDLLFIAFGNTGASTSPAGSVNTPAGWVNEGSASTDTAASSSVRLTIFTKIGDGAESSVTISFVSGTHGFAAVCAAYSSADQTENVKSSLIVDTDDPPICPTITTTVTNTRVIRCCVSDFSGPGAGDADNYDDNLHANDTGRHWVETTAGNGMWMGFADGVYAAAASTGASNYNNNGSDRDWVTFSIAYAEVPWSSKIIGVPDMGKVSGVDLVNISKINGITRS